MSRFIFGESRWPRGEAKGGGCHPLKIQLHPILMKFVPYMKISEKNNISGENSLDGPLKGVGRGAAAPIKNFAWL